MGMGAVNSEQASVSAAWQEARKPMQGIRLTKILT
jgi:hypothetical protein